MRLADIPITLGGDWGEMLHASARLVLERARLCCLQDFALNSDEEPLALRVDHHRSGSPAVWLHEDSPETAIIIVSSGERDWSNLAYQFGHELGHVVANSWHPDSMPKPPSHWLEEALVEAFSLRGLEKLAASWADQPPFAGDSAYGKSILAYQRNQIDSHQKFRTVPVIPDEWGMWLRRSRKECEAHPNLNEQAKLLSVGLIAYYHSRPEAVSALCALNRWPDRSALQLDKYLDNWIQSCREIGVPVTLPEDLLRALN